MDKYLIPERWRDDEANESTGTELTGSSMRI